MKIKVASVQESTMKTSKAGKQYPVTSLTDTDGKFHPNMYGKFEVGQEIEGEWVTNEYGTKFEPAKASFGGSKGGFKSDPNTMLLAYSKDVVVAFIASGQIKTELEASKQIANFATLFKGLLDKLSKGQSPIKTTNETEEKYTNEGQPTGGDEIDIEDLPF